MNNCKSNVDTFTPFTVSGSKKGSIPVKMFYSTSKGLNYFQVYSYNKEKLFEGDIESIEEIEYGRNAGCNLLHLLLYL